MKKIFVILLCFFPFSVFAENFRVVPEDFSNTDFHNNIWYFGSNNMDDIDKFLLEFNARFIERTIAKDNFSNLRQPYFSICERLLNRGRGVQIPNLIFSIMIICDDKYGIMLFWWRDSSNFMGGSCR